MCHETRDIDPFAVRAPDDLDPEQAEILIGFLEAALETLHQNYDYSIIQLRNDRRDDCRPMPPARTAPDGDLPF